MLKKKFKILSLIFLLLFVFSNSINLEPKPQIKLTPQMTTSLDNLPLYFVENNGQLDDEVKFNAKLPNGNVYFTQEGIVHQFFHGKIKDEKNINEQINVEILRLDFLGSNNDVMIKGIEETKAKFSYFKGNNPEKWVNGAKAFSNIIYSELYPHVDLIVYAKDGAIKFDYRVEPGGSVDDIKVRYEGSRQLRVNEDGELEINMASGIIKEGCPFSYQFKNNQSIKVHAEYYIEDENTVRFKIGKYDKTSELIIDPALHYSTYLGGQYYDFGCDITIDEERNAYVTGRTASSDFPITQGSNYPVDWNSDVFITKINSTGTDLIYSTILSGSDFDTGHGIKVDLDGNVYLTGKASDDFPTTPGAFNTDFYRYSRWRGANVFVAKLDSNGSALVYSTFLGSGDSFGIAIDEGGNAYVTGTTGGDFPSTPDAFDPYGGGGSGYEKFVFVTKVNNDGTDLVYSTFLGGQWWESHGSRIAVDEEGNAYVTGSTDSNNFPITDGAYDTSIDSPYYDAFVTKLNSTGTDLVYSTFFGGMDNDWGGDICLDAERNAYIIGNTLSEDLPTTEGSFDIDYNGMQDIFIAKINSSGSDLIYSTYIGGSYWESGPGIAIDENENVYFTGKTFSVDYPITAGAFDESFKSKEIAFVTKLNPFGSKILYSTFLGGLEDSSGGKIAVDREGNAFVMGTTYGDFPVTPGAYDKTFNGNSDAFISKISTIALIEGRIKTDTEERLEGVSISFSGEGTTTTNSKGKYKKEVRNGWSGTVAPSKSGYSFDPPSRTYEEVKSDKSGQNFIASLIKFTLTITSNDGGTTDPPPGNYTYSGNSEVTITATPDPGFRFSGWSGDVSSNDNPITFTIDSGKTITANFKKQYNLMITESTGGITNPGSGTHTYDEGTQVAVTAMPDSGYRFSSWSGDVTNTNNPITVTMDSDKNITANFVKQYTLTISSGTGGTTNPSSGSYTYDEETQVTVTATPDSGYRFSGWSGDITSTENSITITMDLDKSITPTFIQQYSLTIAATTGGTTDPTAGTDTYDTGTQVSVTAIASSGYRFTGWSGDASGSTNPITITMDSDKSITPNFVAQFTLTITTSSGGSTNPAAGTHTYDAGTNVSVTATASSGYTFSNWTGDVSGTTNPISFAMDSNKSVKSNFTKKVDDGGGKKKGCFIATACYGTPMAEEVQILSEFRDKYLMTNPFGRKFVSLYYKHSPRVADYIRERENLKAAVRGLLKPIVEFVSLSKQTDKKRIILSKGKGK